jgi:hypothetical protein
LFRTPKVFEQLIASQQLQVAELQRASLAVGQQIVEARAALEQEFAQRSSSLEAQLAEKVSQKEADLANRSAELDALGDSIAERQKQLDDRYNTHVRRQIRDDLKTRFLEKTIGPQITPRTRQLRLPIHAGVLCALSGLSYLLYVYASQALPVVTAAATVQDASFSYSSAGNVALLVKSFGLTVTIVALSTWYLRWLNKWFERHAEAEFALAQFELDIDRASWVVETALEWRQTEQTPMPAHLIESVSRNLFSKSDKDENMEMHPADYLASALLGKASGLRVAIPGGGEIEWGPKALKDAGKG